jgi:hypothetical protein
MNYLEKYKLVNELYKEQELRYWEVKENPKKEYQKLNLLIQLRDGWKFETIQPAKNEIVEEIFKRYNIDKFYRADGFSEEDRDKVCSIHTDNIIARSVMATRINAAESPENILKNNLQHLLYICMQAGMSESQLAAIRKEIESSWELSDALLFSLNNKVTESESTAESETAAAEELII